MIPDSQSNLSTHVEFLPRDEFSTFDPEVFPRDNTIEKRLAREALIKGYVDVRKLAQVASGLGDKGLSQL